MAEYSDYTVMRLIPAMVEFFAVIVYTMKAVEKPLKKLGAEAYYTICHE